jgi:hypothetical protein
MSPVRLILPIFFIGLFVVYLLYLLIIRKDNQSFKKVFFPGLFFIGIWAVLYLIYFYSAA